MSMQTYYTEDQVKSIVRKELQKENELMEKKRIKNSLHNPKTKDVHLELPNSLSPEEKIPWKNLPRVMNTKEALKNFKLYVKGRVDKDKLRYGHIYKEFQDEMTKMADYIKHNPAGVITSTAFPSLTVTSVNTALINLSELEMEKYNLFNVVETIQNDQLMVVFPEFTRTGKMVKYGYSEEQAIDTGEGGEFTESRIRLGKAGGGIARTEEFDMTTFTFPIMPELEKQLVNEFLIKKHDQILAAIDLATTRNGTDWSAIDPNALRSTNNPLKDINAARRDIRTADRMAFPDLLISNENTFTDYDTNVWTQNLFQPQAAANTPWNGTINNPKGLPWARYGWVINEDMEDSKLLIMKRGALVNVQGVTKVGTYTEPNPQREVLLRKEWFRIINRKNNWMKMLINI